MSSRPAGPPPAGSCLFCKIAAGEVAALVVDEGPDTIAFLDHRPVFPGHCLVATKQHYETMLDVPEAMLAPLFANVQRIARAVESGLGADGSFVATNNRVSQSVPHVHIHVVPRRRKDGLKGFFWPRQKYESDDAARATRDAIRNALV
jgi:histidine triad (HIT) family protein